MKILHKILYYIFILFYFLISVANLFMISVNFNKILNNEALYGIIGILIFIVALATFILLIIKKEYAFYLSVLYGILDIIQQIISNNALKIENLIPAVIMIILSFVSMKFLRFDFYN